MRRCDGARHGLEPAFLSGMLAMEAQVLLIGGELDRASELLAEAERIGAPVDTVALWTVETLRGDLALQSGRPREALEHHARSFEAAHAAGSRTGCEWTWPASATLSPTSDRTPPPSK